MPSPKKISLAGTPWRNGMRFECQGSGRCCTSRGQYGFVYLTLEDRRRFARHFEIPTRRFTREYCEKTDGHFHLKDPSADCVFLEGTRCRAYEARPTQCRTWPFWKDVKSPRAWRRDVVAFCPGIGKGRYYSPEEIVERLKQDS